MINVVAYASYISLYKLHCVESIDNEAEVGTVGSDFPFTTPFNLRLTIISACIERAAGGSERASARARLRATDQ